MGSTDVWCPGINDQFCIKAGNPTDGELVELHADFTVTPITAPDGTHDGTYDWTIGFTEDPAVVQDLLQSGQDPIKLKIAVIPANEFSVPLNALYITYTGSCGGNNQHDSCRMFKHQNGDLVSWNSETLIASGTLNEGETLIWYLHLDYLKRDLTGETAFALPCANDLGTLVDSDLGGFTGQGTDHLFPPFPDGLDLTDPVDGSLEFDGMSQIAGWGWMYYYTAPQETCGDIPPDDNPECTENCEPECIPDPEVEIDEIEPYCTTEIGILAGQHIPVGTATLKMQVGQKVIDTVSTDGYYYTVHVNINAGFEGVDRNGEDRDCTIEPKVPCDSDGDCENVKVQSGVFTKNISKLPLGKYADKCCLPQDEFSLETDILIAEGFVPFGSPFPLSIHLDLQVNCDEEDESGHWTECSSETAFALEPDVAGSCPLLEVEDEEGGWTYDIRRAKHGWGKAIMIDTSDPDED